MKKKIALAALVLILVGGVLFHQLVWRLPPPDSEAKNAVGDKAPDFGLASTTDAKVSLAALRDRRSAVLVFYRGDW